MTGTVVDALQDATAELHAASQLLQALNTSIQANLTATTSRTQTIINNFINRPAVTNVFVDPVNGNDANDGATIDTPRRSLDTVFAAMGSNSTSIFLLNNAQMSFRTSVNAPLVLNGIQKSGAAPGFIPVNRTISFLGTALNSPDPLAGSYCAGLMLAGGTLRTDHIDFALPDVPSGLDYRSHITAIVGTSINTVGAVTLTVSSAQAGFLFGYGGARVTLTGAVAFGAGAAGHLLLGVAAGANPNSSYYYVSNITSA